MKNFVTASAIAIALAFFSCNREKQPENRANAEKEGIQTGGILKINEVDFVLSLLPVAINEVNSYHLASQVYEGLVKYNQSDLSLVPSLARSWEISEDQMEYTFHIRSNAKFHEDSCFEGASRYLNARDVKFCFENLCTKTADNSQFAVTFKDRVEGANEHFAESKSGRLGELSGVTLVDDTTIKVKLVQPDANFLNILTMPGCYIYPLEAVRIYGERMKFHCVGTGPFYIESMKRGEMVLMKKNPSYWRHDTLGNRLPYLDGIHWSFIHDKKAEILEFRRGKLDVMYYIPVELFHELMGDLESGDDRRINFDIYSSPALATHYLGFNLQSNPFFSIKELRLAFNLAIDRHKIAEFIIKGEGRAADHGMVPYTMTFEKNGYKYKELNGYKFLPDSARKLMTMAGYPNGTGLPPFNLEINSGGGDRNIIVAVSIQKMLKENIGVNVNLSVVPWPEHVDNVQTGKCDFFKYAWVSDYADPESFLTLFYGKHLPENYTDPSYINYCRFKNRKYDSLFALARSQTNQRLRYGLYSAAEQVLLKEAPFIPLFYDENFRLEQKHVRNFPENPLNYMDMSEAYLKRPSGSKAKN